MNRKSFSAFSRPKSFNRRTPIGARGSLSFLSAYRLDRKANKSANCDPGASSLVGSAKAPSCPQYDRLLYVLITDHRICALPLKLGFKSHAQFSLRSVAVYSATT